ncbi:Ldh family oxidoreductase [Lentzea sp. NPDC051838]|uniref:Ldh family oxidoreductase n=1 Tax=Lentzea sp. NPDC051838 TaxID=3154849 RepID=UPI00342644D3
MNVAQEWLTGSIARIFRAVGLSAEASSVVAESLVAADMRGVASHGALLVPMYVDRIRRGSVSLVESPVVVTDFGAVATLDAHHGLGVLSGDHAMRMAVSKAQRYGIGAVAVRHAFHFGAAFRFASAAASAGCLGVAAANTRPLMPAPGGARPVVGNNPLAVAVPLPGLPPVVLDMALSEAALGKVRLAASEGRDIPVTWATDRDGVPTTDPVAALEGMLLPSGGPKGYGLALIIDVLTGVLSGGASGDEVRGLYADTGVPNDCAHFFLAIDPEAFGGAELFAAKAVKLVRGVAKSPLRPGVERVYLPGQLEQERAEVAARKGIQVDGGVLMALHKTAESLGVELS